MAKTTSANLGFEKKLWAAADNFRGFRYPYFPFAFGGFPGPVCWCDFYICSARK